MTGDTRRSGDTSACRPSAQAFGCRYSYAMDPDHLNALIAAAGSR